MSKEKMFEFDKLATHYFEEKKKHDALVKLERNKDDEEINFEYIKVLKEKIKHLKKEFEKYDLLAFQEIVENKLDVSELYNTQISKEKTRATRTARYAHYRQWNEANLKDKERWGIDVVKMALKRSVTPVVSCSFGIDSIVTLYIVRKALLELGRDPKEIQVIWNDTLNEFPEVRMYANQLVKDWGLNLLVTKPKKPLKKVIEDHGGMDSSYFVARKGDRTKGRPLSEKCCGVLKHEPMQRAIKEYNWDLVINGLRSDESTQRLRAGLRDGEYFYSNTEWKAFVCRPIMWMTEHDIWDYVELENIPYNELYNKNMIKVYPKNNQELITIHKNKLNDYDVDVEKLKTEQLLYVNKKQALLLKEIGYHLYTPRTGCMQCSIPIKYGYLQWMRNTYPKIFKGMIYGLGYGKVLLEMIPEEVKTEIEFVMNINLDEENAHEFLAEILQAKPCVFDKF